MAWMRAVLIIVGCWLWSAAYASMLHGKKRDESFCDSVIKPWGYPCSQYVVMTEDGFLLGVHRISLGIGLEQPRLSRMPVFLQHGLFQGGDIWFQNTPTQSLGFLLADAGFDVWIGNVRGTGWSYGHISLKKIAALWDWSFDELAEKDLPAMLKFVYNTTRSKVLYVGHSQGTIMGLAAFTQPEVVRIVAAAALLSPISFLGHITSSFVLTAVHMYMDKFLKALGVHELNLRSAYAIKMIDQVCASENVDCGDMLTSITGPNCCFNNSRISHYLEYEPHPSSTKNIEHLFQMIRKGTFEKYNYGLAGNLRHYSRLSPPSYDLSKIPKTFPLWMAYGGQDALADPDDVMLLLQQMHCDPVILYLKDYAHLDFVLSMNGRADLYENLITFFMSQITHSVM